MSDVKNDQYGAMSDTKLDLSALRALHSASSDKFTNAQWHIARDTCMDAFLALIDEVERLNLASAKNLQNLASTQQFLAASRCDYLTVADAVCRESTGPEDVAAQARSTRARLAEVEKELAEARAELRRSAP
jgi:hypothetical protein